MPPEASWQRKEDDRADLVLTNVDDGVLHHLQERVRSFGRTPAEEARTILTDALRDKHVDPWASVDAIYNRLKASGRSFSDGANLLREDRGPYVQNCIG